MPLSKVTLQYPVKDQHLYRQLQHMKERFNSLVDWANGLNLKVPDELVKVGRNGQSDYLSEKHFERTSVEHIKLRSRVFSHSMLANLGADDHGQYLLTSGGRELSGNWDAGNYWIQATRFTSDITTGTSPLTVTSTTLCQYLNADQVDGADLINEDDMASDSDVHVPTQGSVKAYVDNAISGVAADEKVGIDSLATAGYLGAAYGDGVLRVDLNELTYIDGGDYITLGLADHDTARTALGLAIGTDVLAERTIGIADTNLLIVEGSPSTNQYVRFGSGGLEGRAAVNVLGDLSGVANTAFDWNSQNLTSVGTIGCGTITIVDGSSLSLQEDITFTGATTENLIKMPDNLLDALSIQEGSNKYVTFDTVDDEEDIFFYKSVDILHTATHADDHALEIDTDAANLGDVKAVDIDYITGSISAGQDEGIILINIDETLAGGGDVFGLEVLATDGSAGIYGMKVGVVIGPIHQDSGTFINPDTGTDNTPSTDVAVMIDGNPATTTSIFESNGEYIIIGDAAVFEEIEFIITTPASGGGIKPTFWYSTAGSHQFTQFTPVDGTDGLKHTGVVAWDANDLVSHGVNTDTSTYDIKVIRTRVSLTTSPILGYAKTASTTEYIWDKDGDVNIRSLSMTGNLGLTDGTDAHLIKAVAEPGLGGRLTVGLDETTRIMFLCDYGDIDADHGLSVQSHPTLYISNAAASTVSYYNYFKISLADGQADISSNSGQFSFNSNGVLGVRFRQNVNDISSGHLFSFVSNTNIELTDADAEQAWMYLEPKISMGEVPGTGNYVGFLMNVTETILGSGTNELMALRVGGTDKFTISNSGDVALTGGLDVAKLLNISGAPESVTIAGGVITVTESYVEIDTQSGDGTDDLDTINGGTEGDIIILKTANSARDVVVKDVTGNIILTGSDRTLLSVYYRIMLQYDGSFWVMLNKNF